MYLDSSLTERKNISVTVNAEPVEGEHKKETFQGCFE